jgi:hypothetical protein
MPETVSHQEHIPTRTMHDAELLSGGAQFHEKLGHLMITDEQYDKLHAGMPGQEAEVEQAESMPINPEKVQEIVSKIAKSSDVALNTWVGQGVFKEGGVSFLTVTSSDEHYYPAQAVADWLSKGQTVPNKVAELNVAGVSEIVTFSNLSPSPEHGNMVDLSYELTSRLWNNESDVPYSTRGRMKHYRTGQGQAESGSLRYEMIMEEEQAKEIEGLIKADPENLHLLTDIVVGKVLGGDIDEWHKQGPQYDQWRELSEDGKNRIAIRHDITNPDGPSEILEY